MLLKCWFVGVSERYRELIEAADTITEMKRSSDSVRLVLVCLLKQHCIPCVCVLVRLSVTLALRFWEAGFQGLDHTGQTQYT